MACGHIFWLLDAGQGPPNRGTIAHLGMCLKPGIEPAQKFGKPDAGDLPNRFERFEPSRFRIHWAVSSTQLCSSSHHIPEVLVKLYEPFRHGSHFPNALL